MPIVHPPRHELRDYLAQRDAPCPDCGYCLRGVRESRCPECGEALRIEEVRRAFINRNDRMPKVSPPTLTLLVALAVWTVFLAVNGYHLMRGGGAVQVVLIAGVLGIWVLLVAGAALMWARGRA